MKTKINELCGNNLLALLPADVCQRLLPSLRKVTLAKGEIIYPSGGQIRQVYFPITALISFFGTTSEGQTIEVGLAGYDGFVGLPALWHTPHSPFHTTVQFGGQAWQSAVEPVMKEFNRCGALHKIIMRYTYAMSLQMAQSAVCNHFHTLEERLCRWLLASRDRQQSNQLELTQELISAMLGSNRSHVTTTACLLQRAGLISYKRGVITLLDHKGLEETACECYGITKRNFARFLN